MSEEKAVYQTAVPLAQERWQLLAAQANRTSPGFGVLVQADELRQLLAASRALQQAETAAATATQAAAKAEAERDHWKQEALAHAQRVAVVTQDAAAPYCDGKCGICYCQPSL